MTGREPISFTLDLEEHRRDPTAVPRFPEVMATVLPFLDKMGVRGTFFVVGEVARQHPQLVRELAACGHEVAFHSRCHRPLVQEDPARFRQETGACKRYLEDLTGCRVAGFRAPVFSLVRETTWAVDVLQELGFEYSSSVLPAPNPLFGFAEAPRRPFRWPNSLIELPVPVATFFGLTLPYLGGVYLRYLPMSWILAASTRVSGGWTYIHPYDFDRHEPFSRIRDASLLTSILLWFRRGGTFKRVERLLDGGAGLPLVERVRSGEFVDALTFDVPTNGGRINP